jgi:hypothetical protein
LFFRRGGEEKVPQSSSLLPWHQMILLAPHNLLLENFSVFICL